MRGSELLDKMELADPAYVQAAEVPSPKRKHYARWGALAACLCLVAAGALVWALNGTDANGSAGDCTASNGAGAQQPDNMPTAGEDGVTIPPMEVTLSKSDGIAMEMQAFFIYQGRCYVQYEWLYDSADVVGERLGTATGLINEWTPSDGYVELAGSVSGDFYAVKGFDPTFMLCMVSAQGEVQTFVCSTGITLKYGAQLYEERLHLTGNYAAVEYETRQSWYYSEGDARQLTDAAAALDFVEALDGAEFLLWSDAVQALGEDMSSVYDREIYHLYFRMDNGMTVHLRLYEGGYVRYAGIMDVCVQVPPEEYDVLLTALENR